MIHDLYQHLEVSDRRTRFSARVARRIDRESGEGGERERERKERKREKVSEMVYQIFIDHCANFARARISLKQLNLSSNVNASQKYEINREYLTTVLTSAVRTADSRNS